MALTSSPCCVEEELERSFVDDEADSAARGEAGSGTDTAPMTVDEVFDQIVASVRRESE